MRRVDRPQATHEPLAQLVGPFSEVLLEQDGKGRLTNGGRQRITAKSRTMIARMEDVHDLRVGEHSRHGIDAATQCLAENQHVRADTLPLAGQ